MLILSTSVVTKAINVSGYIVNEAHDTIFGLIKLRNIDNLTGALLINGYDLSVLHYQISFKKEGDKKFQILTTDMVVAFGFQLNDSEFLYKRFLLENRNIFSYKDKQMRFLKLIYHGAIDLYENRINLDDPSARSINGEYVTYYEYYIFNNTKDILRVDYSEEYPGMRDILRQLEVEEKFLHQIPLNTRLNDIESILKDYDEWLNLRMQL